MNPTSVVSGALAVGTAAYLAAVYLTRDAQRAGDMPLTEAFRRRALVTGLVVGVLSAAGLVVSACRRARAVLRTHLRQRPASADPLVASGLVSLGLLRWGQRFLAVRLTAALAVAGLLWGWGIAQYPRLLPGATLQNAFATDTVLSAGLVSLAAGAVLLLPSLWWLYSTFQRAHPRPATQADQPTGGDRHT
ncbi:cytochrome d ubiquinol oxidase subunit II [Streptomyces sp. NPDC005393]|uniref:cytochrome d ubiquinol oxidase subunit II n=1 Tax=Streptomyces sp. NPDC005393 TaxID=3157041 RepID=UPI0033A31D2A